VKVSHSEGLANHTVPESWLFTRKGLWQALTGAGMGWVLSREISYIGVPTAFLCTEGNTGRIAMARGVRTPRGQRPHARTEAPRAEPGRSRRRPWPVAKVRVVNQKVQP